MTTSNGSDQQPLWLAVEEIIQRLDSQQLSGAEQETTVRSVASSLDERGWNISKNAGNMLEVRGAIAARVAVGRSLLDDLNEAFGALTLEGLRDPYGATVELVQEVGESWPALKESRRRSHLVGMLEEMKLRLLTEKAKGLGGDEGVRLLIKEGVGAEVIISRLGITEAEHARVAAAVEAERAERTRVAALLKDAGEKPVAEKIRYLINQGAADLLIQEMVSVEPSAIEAVRKEMEEELAEKKRLAEEAAAKKAAEAAGPSLEDIPSDEMLDHIDAIREILEFSDVEKEIRVMCEQSGIPLDLVDIAVSDPGRLDELEAQAGG